jgi:predicted aspartyl protease
MKKGIALLLLFSFLLNSCSTIKSVLILGKADVNVLKEKETFMYESSFSLLLLTVKIKGHSYLFVFDTGASATVVSKDLADAIGLKEASSITAKDAHNSSQKLSVGFIDTLSLGRLRYTHVGVLVNDLKQIPEFSCLNIDGILGMNAIGLNNWKINYDSSSITVSDINSKLLLPETFKPIAFTVNGGPHIDFTVNGVKENFLIDMGSSGSISVSSKVKFGKADALLVGYATTGLFGGKFDTTKLYKVNTFTNPQLTISNILVSQAKSLGALIGTGFLEKSYSSVVFDFKNKSLLVQEKNNKDNKHLSYGFTPKMLKNKVVVGTKYLNFSEEITKVNVGDTISEINNTPIINPCDMLSELKKLKNNTEPITIKVSKGKTVQSYNLAQKPIVE